MKKSLGRSGLILAALLALAALLPIVAASGDRAASTAPREIRLVVRDMTFYLEGQSTPNPTLRVRAGEQIRLVLRNEQPGMSHDLAIATWQVQTPSLQSKGEEATVSFRVPDRPGTAIYSCTPHAQMMRGRISVE
jgi:plastocyanin